MSNPTDIAGNVYCADFIGRDQVNHYGFSADDVERLIEKVLAFMRAGGVFLPVSDSPERLQIEHDGEKLVFHPGAARQLAGQGQERAYLLALTVDQEYQRWATRFVPLAGKMDVRQVLEGLPIAFTELIIPTGEGGHGQITQKPLASLAEAMQSHGAFVILGEPGAGKTTTQQKIAFDAARGLLEHQPHKVPLFVRLSQQGDRDPYTFLQTEWERRTGLPFGEALKAGRLLILADGLNEIPTTQRNTRLHAWMVFDQHYRGANQLIFSGREKDYDNQLNLPRVLVEPLDESRITAFLKAHQADGLAELLDNPQTHLRDLARNPLNLFVLVMVYLQGGKNLQMLANRGRLFQTFAHNLLHHEQLWHPDALSVDAKTDLYARLAYAMQKQGTGTTFPFATACQCLPATCTVMGEEVPLEAHTLFRYGRGASILDPATLPDVRFHHHLLQEYFAARELLRRFNAGEDLTALWQVPRLITEMPNAQVGEWDPLPDPPTTGWEVTTILACGLARDPTRLLEAIRLHNPILAGRCLDEAGLPPLLVSEAAGEGAMQSIIGVRERVQADLLADLYNPAIHLRARLLTGLTLGKIGDPRFQPQTLNSVKVIVPQMIGVPAGKYWIGSSDTDQDEKPPHPIELSAFSIGRWPVTNAEFGCFIEAGGYKNETYWEGELAKRWLRGEDVAGGQMSGWMRVWKYTQTYADWKIRLERTGSYTPEDLETREYISHLSEEEFRALLSRQLNTKSRTQPQYWKDQKYNNPSQPVAGLTWFEARAYCAWLSAITGHVYRLPTEPEWEAAARGADGRIFSWGNDFDPSKANTIEGRVLRPSPVGAYAATSLGPFQAEDQTGNVWEWTSSLYLPYPYKEKAEDLETTEERVVRGGSFGNNRDYVRCAGRDWIAPDNFLDFLGFRVVSPGFLNADF